MRVNRRTLAWTIVGVGGVAFLLRLDQPILLVGALTVDGREPGVMSITVSQDSTKWYRVMDSDISGRFELSIPKPGSYTLTIGQTGALPVAAIVTEIDRLRRKVSIDLPAGEMAVQFRDIAGNAPREKVRLRIEGPVGQPDRADLTGFIVAERRGYVRLKGIRPGTYRVTGTSVDGSVGAEEVSVAESASRELIEISLKRRQGTLTIQTSDGQPVQGKAAIGYFQLKRRGVGFALDTAAPGQQLAIGAAGYQPTCRILRTSDWPTLTITLERAVSETPVRLHNVVRPVGHLRNVPGAECDVPLFVAATGQMAVQASLRSVDVRLAAATAHDYVYILDNAELAVPINSSGTKQDVAIPTSVDSCLRRRVRAVPAG